jgi:Ca-activated chloride channel family protein
MKARHFLVCVLVTLQFVLLSAGCGLVPPNVATFGTANPKSSGARQLNLFVGSEQEDTMKTIVQPWCQTQGWNCQYRKKGSVDQKTILQSGVYADSDGWQGDGFWFASSVWPTIGDTKGVLRDKQSMYVSPTVFATWKRVADANGWSGKPAVPILDIFNASKNNGVRIWWSNPSQSNSGATGYLSLLTALAGNSEGVPLTLDQINASALQTKAQQYVRLIEHSSPSTKDVTDTCIANKNRCDGVFTYESLVIQKNLERGSGQEPLIVVYPKEIALNDSYLTFVPNSPLTDAAVQEKEKFFLSLQQYLQTPQAISKILAIGWRAGSSPLDLKNADPTRFNSAWGIQTTLRSTPIAYPAADAITRALMLYQTSFRRPVDAVYCLDTSGSMEAGKANGRWVQVSAAAKDVFVRSEAERYQLLTHPQDLTQVLFFSDKIDYVSPLVTGDDYTALGKIYNDIVANNRGGNTDIYGCAERALSLLKTHPTFADRRPLIFLMTDGQSNTKTNPNQFLASRRVDLPTVTVIAIGFSNEADGEQLHSLADPTDGTVIYTDATAYGKDTKSNKILATDFAEAMKYALGYK